MSLSYQLCVMGWTQHLGTPQWDLQDVSGRQQQQETLRTISRAGVALGPPEWFLSEDPPYGKSRAGESLGTRDGVHVFLYLYNPSLPFSNPFLLLPWALLWA